MFSGRACIVVAKDISELTLALGIVLEDAIEVTQARAEGVPIPILQLYVQHLYQLEKQGGGGSKAERIPHFLTQAL